MSPRFGLRTWSTLTAAVVVVGATVISSPTAFAQSGYDSSADVYRPAPESSVGSGGYGDGGYGSDAYRSSTDGYGGGTYGDAYTRPRGNDVYQDDNRYDDARAQDGYAPEDYERYGSQPAGNARRERYDDDSLYGGEPSYGEPYAPPGEVRSERAFRNARRAPGWRNPDAGRPAYDDETYSSSEIVDAGHRFFGSITAGLAEAVEFAFQRAGRPNGYILGEEAGGAFVAGVRYGEGTLYTKSHGTHRVYWQGPSLGYDFGAEGSKTITLVYDIASPADIYSVFGGVDGSAYLVGGVGLTFLRHDYVTLAPIRSGVGLRLGANVGYLRYTRRPNWLPF